MLNIFSIQILKHSSIQMLQHLNIEQYRNNQNNQIIKIITGQTSSVFKYSSIETFFHINAPTLKHWKL